MGAASFRPFATRVFAGDREAITEGLSLVERALRLGPIGQYQLQGAIAALHAEAATAAETEWAQITALYGKLLEINPSPVIALNHSVAIAMCGLLVDGLRRIDELGRSGTLDQYYLFHAALADLLRRRHRNDSAAAAYREAARLATNPIEVQFLHRRLQELDCNRL